MYPLKQNEGESKRLNSQFRLLGDYKKDEQLLEAKTVLDIGCGTGHFLDYLHDSVSYTGIDINDIFEKDRLKHKFIGHNFLDFDFKDVKYDLIHIRLVLWSTPDPKKILTKSKGLLEKGGRVIIYEPDDTDLNFGSAFSSISKLSSAWHKHAQKSKCNPFIGSQLKSLMKSVAFHNIKETKEVIRRDDNSIKELSTGLENLLQIFENISPCDENLLKLIEQSYVEIRTINKMKNEEASLYYEEGYYFVEGSVV